VKTLVELHGGAITAHSEGPGWGSEFVVRLPALQAAESTPGPPAQADHSSPHDKPPRRRILVVDDNLEAADSLGNLLKRLWGQEVRVSYDGSSALELAGEFRPEVFLLDIGMPGMDGYEVARRLRGRPEFQRTLIVAVTGWGQEEDRRRSREAGFDLHLVKPVEIEEFRRLLVDPEGVSLQWAG
jgi:CheY-like chemotaxis protein